MQTLTGRSTPVRSGSGCREGMTVNATSTPGEGTPFLRSCRQMIWSESKTVRRKLEEAREAGDTRKVRELTNRLDDLEALQ